MAQSASAEDNARKILQIYDHFEAKEGHVLRSNNFIAVGNTHHWDMRDLQQGLDYALEQGWLKPNPDGWLSLTNLGFEQM